MFYRIKITLAVFIALTGLLAAQSLLKKITMEELVNLDYPGKTVFSPDASKAAFVMKKGDFVKSAWNSQIYLMDLQTGKYGRFSPEGASCTEPFFIDGGKKILYLTTQKGKEDTSDSDDEKQLWVKNSDGSAGKKITSLKRGIDEYAYSQKAGLLALLSNEYLPEKEKAEKENAALKIDAREYPEKLDNKIVSFFSLKDLKVINSYALDPGAKEISFNAAGDRIIFQTNYTGEFNDEQKYDIYIIDINGKKQQITSQPGPETSPKFSPDDKLIAYITQTAPDIEFAKTELCVSSPDGSGKKNLTAGFPYSVESFIWESPSSLIILVNLELESSLYRIDILTGGIDKLTKTGQNVTNFFSTTEKRLIYTAETSTEVPEIYVSGVKKSAFSDQLQTYAFGKQEAVKYRSRDDKFDITGVVFYPPEYDSQKKYPTILNLHGGPFGNFKNTFNQWAYIRLLNNAGYIVFAPNPRGSSGGTDEFGQANRYDLGGGDYRDVMDGVDFLISKGIADEDRLGVTGGSYGGYLTNWVISQNSSFKAAVSMFGIFSFITDWSNSWQPAFENMYLGYNYWDKPINFDNQYINRSPAFYVKNITTPVLILQGEKDVYTDAANSREMYQALKACGVPVKFVLYPREGHGIKGEPNHYKDVITRMIEWFNTYVK
jgi:dipeptidyl aminopeptidase/acylaminoacyl peptidase